MSLILCTGRIEAAFVSRLYFRCEPSRTCRMIGTASFRPQATSNNGEDGLINNKQVMQTSTKALLEATLGRAMDTLATRYILSQEEYSESSISDVLDDVQAAVVESDASSSDKEHIQRSLRSTTQSLLQGSIDRARRTLTTKALSENGNSGAASQPDSVSQTDPYLTNPAITPTALAHQIWAHALRPNVDTAIDATCGNGNDSVAIASMLFNDNEADPFTITGEPQLICIDVQKEACETTRSRLSDMLNANTMTCNVNVLCQSHSPLPRPRNDSSVGLVCYNLGYLPQSERTILTQMESTIQSIADAALMMRIGGIISVTTYPRSNKNEDYAVHALLEGLALLSSKTVDWRRDYVDELGPDPDVSSGNENEYTVQDTVRAALERIVAEGPRKQTWRVLENKMLGRSLSPILLTATRIK